MKSLASFNPILIAAATSCIGLTFSTGASASWLSDFTGINVDIPGRKFSVGAPNPQAIPQMLQHLPQDAANFFLSPGGPPLALFIRSAESQALPSARPIPSDLRQMLSPYFPPEILDTVRWTTQAESGVNLASSAERANGQIAAMTVNRVIVFRGPTEAQDYGYWAHELVHVSQYRNMGIEGFAAMYVGWGAQRIEDDAYAWQGHVIHEIQTSASDPTVSGTAQWQSAGSNTKSLTWSDFHDAALRAIPPAQCAHFKNIDSETLQVHNLCQITLRVVAMHAGAAFYGCMQAACYIPPDSCHLFRREGATAEIDTIDFRFGEDPNRGIGGIEPDCDDDE